MHENWKRNSVIVSLLYFLFAVVTLESATFSPAAAQVDSGTPSEDVIQKCSAQGWYGDPKQFSLDIDNQTYVVAYLIAGAKLNDMKVDQDRKSVIVDFVSESDGCLKIGLPKSMIDAQGRGYIVTADGRPQNFQQVSDSSQATQLHVSFINGTRQIEIQGSWLIPEFGPTLLFAALPIFVAISFARMMHRKMQ